MSELKMILAVFVIASFQYYEQCHGQQSIEDILYDRIERGLETKIFVRVPPQIYSDRNDWLRIASELTDNVKSGRFRINDGYKRDGSSIPFDREKRLDYFNPEYQGEYTGTIPTLKCTLHYCNDLLGRPPRTDCPNINATVLRDREQSKQSPSSLSPGRPASKPTADPAPKSNLASPPSKPTADPTPKPNLASPVSKPTVDPASKLTADPAPKPNPARPTSKPIADSTPILRPAQPILSSLILNRENPKPCEWNILVAEMPIINVSDRRVSEIKCEEYIYRSSYIDAEFEKKLACDDYIHEMNPSIVELEVFGGRDTTPEEFPHMGALGWRRVDGDWKFQCGASLISEKFLLTAAHCSKASSADTSLANTSPEIVRLGVANLKTFNDAADGEIAQIIVHPQYSSPRLYFDIALVELKEELTFANIRPACLWTQDDTSQLGDRGLVTGWGYVDTAVTTTAANLQVADVDIIDLFLCEELLRPHWNRNFNGLRSHQICAGVLTGGVDTCRGDSGGPLQVKIPSSDRLSFIIGVTSFGRGCARPKSPGIYTRVSSFLDWIERIVWPN